MISPESERLEKTLQLISTVRERMLGKGDYSLKEFSQVNKTEVEYLTANYDLTEKEAIVWLFTSTEGIADRLSELQRQVIDNGLVAQLSTYASKED